MTIFTYEASKNVFQVFSEEKNSTKVFEILTKNDRLINIKIYYPNGQLLNETCLVDGKITAYKIYNDIKSDDRNQGKKETPKLEYEINLDKIKALNNYKLYDFDTNKLIYEGGYVNNKKNGYGTEYHTNGNLLYQGDFIENKKSGYGTIFDKNNRIKYSGNWQNDQMHDQGTFYFENGNIKFSGIFLVGKKNGFGTSYDQNGNKKYEGNWCMDMRIGDGKMFYTNGSLHIDGHFGDGFFNGITYNQSLGKIYDGKLIYQHENKLYVKQGIGKSFYENGIKEYSGHWKINKYDGSGTLYFDNGNVKYSGQFENNKFHGFGVKYDFCENLMCMGHWSDGKLERINLTDEQQLKGYQSIDYGDAEIYIGEVSNNVGFGYGELYDKETGFRYFEGSYKADRSEGLCKYFHENQNDHQTVCNIGYKANGKWHGIVYKYFENGKHNTRVFCNDNNRLDSKFKVEYHTNGKIDLEKSYKGDLYFMEDLEKDNA